MRCSLSGRQLFFNKRRFTTISDELTAVQNQIIAEMKPDQLKAMAALQITNSQLSAFYAENGIVLPTPVPGVTKVPGGGKIFP